MVDHVGPALAHLMGAAMTTTSSDNVSTDLMGLSSAASAAVPSLLGLHLVIPIDGCDITYVWYPPTAGSGPAPAAVTSIRLPVTAGQAGPMAGPSMAATSAGMTLRLFASTPGAFVDLAADLTYALGLDPPHTASTTTDTDRDTDRDTETDTDTDTETDTETDTDTDTDRVDADADVDADQVTPGMSDNPSTIDPSNAPRAADGQRRVLLDADLPPLSTTTQIIGLDVLDTINQAVGVLIYQGHHPDRAHAELVRRAAAANTTLRTQAERTLASVSP